MARDAFGNYVIGLSLSVPPLPGPHGGSGSTQIMSGTDADPNGSIVPDDEDGPAFYYQEPASNLNIWLWDPDAHTWTQYAVPSADMRSADYGGAEPDWTPAATLGVAVDQSNSRIWWHYGGQWN